MVFELELDFAERLLVVRIGGFWTEKTMRAFAEQLSSKMADIGRIGDKWGTICVAEDLGPQQQWVVDRHREIFLSHRDVWGDRTATVMKGALVRNQLKRVLPASALNIFDDEASAREYLRGRLGAQKANVAAVNS